MSKIPTLLIVRALKEGATDFILKPWDNHKLLSTIQSAYQLQQSQKEVSYLKQKTKDLKQLINKNETPIIGNSKAINQVLKMTRKVAKTKANVLITGENGTGKGLIALAIHNDSFRKDEVLVSVDLGAITESLFES